jgi:hypothetical protein
MCSIGENRCKIQHYLALNASQAESFVISVRVNAKNGRLGLRSVYKTVIGGFYKNASFRKGKNGRKERKVTLY